MGHLIMRLGRHGGTKFSVPVSKNVDQMKYPPGSKTFAKRKQRQQLRGMSVWPAGKQASRRAGK